jgi:dolichol-phosphate mannosyltransferase
MPGTHVAGRRLISIVVPVFNEAKNLPILVERFEELLVAGGGSRSRTGGDPAVDSFRWEYVFVNDGSPDDSLEVLRALQATNPRVRILDLSRNFGKEAALSAGLAHAHGDAVICIDADLQHPPELIPELVDHWVRGAEVVVTVREQTEEPSIVRRAGSALFYWLLARLSDVEVVGKSTDFRLLDRRVVDEFLKMGDRDRLVRGLVDWLGFRRVCVTFRASARVHGSSTFSYGRLVSLFFNGIMSHSSAPLKWVGILGVVVTTLFSLLLVIALVAEKQLKVGPLALVTLGIVVLIGVVLTALGVVAVYVARIYAEVVRRPLFVVREEVAPLRQGAAGQAGSASHQPSSAVQARELYR